MLLFGIVFGCLSMLPTSPLVESALAIGENDSQTNDPVSDPTSPENEPSTPSTDPENPNNSPDQDETNSSEDNPEEGNEDNSETDDEDDSTDLETEESTNVCYTESGILGWIVCGSTEFLSSFIDSIYSTINDFLVVKPISMDSQSAIYIVWQYARNITNTVFIIFLLIVIFSQVTGFGINNYGIKRVLPRLIITVILVNLSFIICSLAVDVSNIIGSSLRGFFEGIKDNMLVASGENAILASIDFGQLVAGIVSGGTVAGIVISAAGGLSSLFWLILPVLVGAAIAVITGVITIAGRQAIVALLIMISPLAFVAYLLPNTEVWFSKWKNLLARMLIFFPMFSFIFGASQLTGWTLIASASDGLGIILGLAVQVFPLFLSVSLMKMSGTILGSVNNALRSLASPIQRVTTDISAINRNRARDQFIMNSGAPGAHLRKYLDARRELRMSDSRNVAEARHDRAIEAAMIKSSSITGRNKLGSTTWEEKPNKYTRNAKTANYWHTKASNAAMAYNNTLTAYGRHFADAESQTIAEAHGEAFLDSMAQQFLATNEAQADQDWLLDKYLKAKTNLKNNVYQYNRLIKDAAGGLGHNGESSIMGQVIQGNSAIENRRRTEARIMINKFGMEKHKQELRWMVLDKKVNDNGFAINAFGDEIEDDQYNLLPKCNYIRWDRYIGVHKTTGAEITKDEYDALSSAERSQYRKVKYFDITDDHGNEVQRVFEDDAGYMKEILNDDILIADPIAQRFLAEIYVSHNPNESDGKLRKYHSTIRTAIDNGGISGHGAGITPLLTSAANAGIIDSMGQFNITTLQSLAVAMKPGNLQKNDAFYIDQYRKLVDSIRDPESFAHYYPDEAILRGRTNNDIHIDGLELATREVTDADGNTRIEQYWKDVNYQEVDAIAATDPKRAIELRKNFIKHKYMKKAIISLIGGVNRPMTPDVLSSLKPGAVPALKRLGATLKEIGLWTLDPTTPFEERIDGDTNIFEIPDSQDICRSVREAQDEILTRYGVVSNPGRQNHPNNSRRANTNNPNLVDLFDLPDDYVGEEYLRQQQPARSASRESVDDMYSSLARAAEYNKRNDPALIADTINEYSITAHQTRSLEIFIQDLTSYFREVECLRERSVYSRFADIILRHKDPPHASSDEEARAQVADPYSAYGEAAIDAIKQEVIELINDINSR